MSLFPQGASASDFYYSSAYFARDVMSNLGPFSAFVISAYLMFPDGSAFSSVSDVFGKAEDSWALSSGLLIVFVMGVFGFGQIAQRLGARITRLLRFVGLSWLNRVEKQHKGIVNGGNNMTNRVDDKQESEGMGTSGKWNRRFANALVEYCDWDTFYVWAEDKIALLYKSILRDLGKYDVLLEGQEADQRVMALMNYLARYNTGRHAAIQRLYAINVMILQLSTYGASVTTSRSRLLLRRDR